MKHNYTLIILFAFLLSLASVQLSAQCAGPASMPYYENFSGITANNQLPPCWAASNMSTTCLTYTNTGTTANPRGAFFDTPSGTNHFFSRGMQLYAGVTYSASVWRMTDNTNSTNWTNFSLHLNTLQSATGATQVASTAGAANSSFYTSLTSTFTVPTSAVYYLVVSATSNGAGTAPYLYWDDLFITMPCSLGNNSPVATTQGPTSGCLGQTFTVSTAGWISNAHTYTWSNGSNAISTTYTPSGNMNIWVAATNTLTGCSATANLPILANLSPIVGINTLTTSICKGSSVILTAYGASNYNWTSGASTATISVSPTVSSGYTVTGVNSAGCTGTASVSITVKPVPSLSVSSSASTVCVGQSVLLNASGASTYLWDLGNGLQSVMGTIQVNPSGNTTYTVTGTEPGGCADTQTLSLKVDECTGIDETSVMVGMNIYPNPVRDFLTIESEKPLPIMIEVNDISGRIVQVINVFQQGPVQLHTSELQNGVYFIKLSGSDGSTIAQKIIKH